MEETREVLDDLKRFGDDRTEERLLALGRRAREIVPECVGLSLAVLSDGLTFTLVASSDEIATLDAVQYLDGGPCVAGAQNDESINIERLDQLDEDRWRMFAQTSAASGIRSTLTLPIVVGGKVVGSVNLYASSPGAFDGHHDALAQALGASAADAVTNADLSFDTRLEAAKAPARLKDEDEISMAVGIVSAAQDVDLPTARERIRQAAARAGISEVQAARTIRRILIN